MFTELLLATSFIAQSVGPGYVGRPSTPFYICLNNPSSYLNVRSKPTTQSKRIGKLRHFHPVSIISRGPGIHDGMWWAYIRTYEGNTGFVRDDYVCVR
jgi:hypothetical protein